MENKVRIELYSPDHYEIWKSFLNESVNGTHFHSMDFLSYHSQNKFNLSHLLFFKKGKLLGVMPSAITTDSTGYRTMLSPFGGSYGGIVHKRDLSFSDAMAMLDSLGSFARLNNIQSIRLTFPPHIYYEYPCCHFEFLLLAGNARLANRDLSQAIDTSCGPEKILSRFSPQCRNKVRKAEKKGLHIQHSNDVESFYEILIKNKAKHNERPTHTLDELMAIRKLNANWAKVFLALTKDGRVAGGVMTMCCNKKVLLSFYTCHLEDFSEYSPVNLLNYKIACWAHMKNFHWFDLGTSTVNMEIRHSLINFKESFGSLSVNRDSFQLDIIN